MSFRSVFFALAGAVVLLSAFTALSRSAKADETLSDEKPLPLGQLLIVGFKGHELNEGLADVIKETKPGGILLFGRNVKSAEQVARLNFHAQALSKKVSKAPLLVAIDQEGGNVIRIRHTPNLPSALAIAKTRDLKIARRSGTATGYLLKTLGINTNLAPVVDVSNPDTDNFLGTRSYGGNPKRVAAMTTAVALGLQESGVLPVAKHFPGHGDASGDSHLIAATSPSTREQLMERDLIPYMSFAKSLTKPWGAMLAHVSFPAIDPSHAPATFSKPIVTGILREDVSRSALVMTDDIEMAGAGAEKNVGLRAVRAIEAGADMVMIAWSRSIQREVMKALKEAVDSGRLKRSRVEESIKRIEAARRSYIPTKLTLASTTELTRSLHNPEFRFLGNAVLKAAARNLEERRPSNSDTTLATDREPNSADEESDRNEPENSPRPAPARLIPSNDPVIVLSARRDFLSSFKKRAKGFHVKTELLTPSRSDAVKKLLQANPESAVFAYVSGKQVAKFISDLDDVLVSKMILVNIETNASIERPERFRDIFEIYYRHPDLGATVAEGYLEVPPLAEPTTPKRNAASLLSEPEP